MKIAILYFLIALAFYQSNSSSQCVYNISPHNNDTISYTTPNFSWFRGCNSCPSINCQCFGGYGPPDVDLRISTDSLMNDIIYTKGLLLGTNNFTIPGNVLQDNQVYWWNMKVVVMWLCIYSWPNCLSGSSGSCQYYSVPFRLYTRFNPISVSNISESIPEKFSLLQNYPNPFNPVTSIKFEIPKSESVILTISDALGREVETIVNKELNPGSYQAEWDAANYPSGVYYYKITAGEYTETKKMVLIK